METEGEGMTRLFGEAPTLFTLWLLMILSVAILVVISTTLAQAAPQSGGAATVAPIDRQLGALRAFAERIGEPAPVVRAAWHVHPSLADGGPAFRHAVMDRLIAGTQRRLEARPADPPWSDREAATAARLLADLQSVRVELAALARDPELELGEAERAAIQARLAGLHQAVVQEERRGEPDGVGSYPLVLRGADL